MSEMLEYEIAPLTGNRVGVAGPRWIAWTVAFVVLVAAIALMTLSDGTTPVTREAAPSGPAAVATETVPAFVAEQIVYGERAPGDVTAGVEILPVYMIEAITYGEMEPPTG